MEMYVGGVDAMEQFQERRARDKTRMDWMDPGRTRIRMQQWCDNQKAQPKWTTKMHALILGAHLKVPALHRTNKATEECTLSNVFMN